LLSSQTVWLFNPNSPAEPATQVVYEHRETLTASLLNIPKADAAVAPDIAASAKQQTLEPSRPAPSLDVKVNYRYYPIVGTSAAALRSQMNQQGPIDTTEQRRYDAKTEWLVQWSYRYRRQGAQCAIGQLSTHVDVTITYPQWSAPSGVSSALQTEWQRYMLALQTHENGHKDNGIAAGRSILQALAALPASPSCQALDAAANSMAQRVVSRYNQNDLDYDRDTAHGSTHGAVFPGPTIALR
ncbi:MAG TPA: DUF922 domain-containing Zn-dependent protease, partial [Trichocoleus sp.]